MMNGSDDIMKEIANWNLEADLSEISNDNSVDIVIYKQLQSYLKIVFRYFESISRISSQIRNVVQDFVSESSQIEQVAAFLKKGAEQQTLEIEKSVKLVEDFSEKINAIYDKSSNIISLAYDMEKTNSNVRESVDQLVLNQENNDHAIKDISEVVKNLIEKTHKIGNITNLINRISSETNLLGLNAKVEAVRAGSAGRGFSVVANEIQRLSMESKEASVSISNTIKSVTDEISLLEKVALKSQDTFKAQRDSVNGVNIANQKNTAFINIYINEQKSFNLFIEEIKAAEDLLVKSISNVLSSVREISATAHEISSLTYNQNNSISLLGKLEDNLSTGVASIDEVNQHIRVQKVSSAKKRIAMIFDTDNAFWDPTKKDTMKAADIYDYEVSFYAPKQTGIERIKEMAGFLDKASEDKYEGLVISPIDDELIYQKLRKLNRIGTKIVFINSRIDNIDYVSLIQTDGIAAGAAAAHVVMGVMGVQGEVIVNTWSDMQISAIENRKNGFIQELQKNTSIKVHEAAVHSKPYFDEGKTIDAILHSIPSARFLYLTNCEWGLAVARYMEKHHMDIQVITIDFTKEIQEAMSKGLIHYAIGQRAYSWGSMAISFIDRSIHNKSVKKYVDTGTYEVNLQNMNIYKINLS